MTEAEWARTSISVWRGTGEPEVHSIPGDGLAEQLQAAQEWFRNRHASMGVEAEEAVDVRLLCSWSPGQDQHAMTLSGDLIAALARANATYWMDVYPPEAS